MDEKIITKIIEKINNETKESQARIEKEYLYQKMYSEKVRYLTSLIAKMDFPLEKMGLEICEVNYFMYSQNCLGVTIIARVIGDKFKFISDKGFSSNGDGRNYKQLSAKASKMAETLKEYTGFSGIAINPFSLEYDQNNENNVIINVNIK